MYAGLFRGEIVLFHGSIHIINKAFRSKIASKCLENSFYTGGGNAAAKHELFIDADLKFRRFN